jgi:hypothetical protein
VYDDEVSMSCHHLPATVSFFARLIRAATAAATAAGIRLARRSTTVARRVGVAVIVAATTTTTTVVAALFPAVLTAIALLTTARGVAINTASAAAATAATTTAVTIVVTVVTTTVVTVIAAAIVTAITVGVIAAIAVVLIAAPAATVGTTAVIVAVTTAAAMSTTEFTLGRTKVLAGSRGTGTAATSLFDAESATFDHLALQTFLGGIGLLRRHHLDEAKPTGLLGVRVDHDGAVLHITVLLEQARDIGLGQARVDTRNEKVGASVDGALLIIIDGLTGVNRSTVIGATIGRPATGAITPGLIARRRAAIAGVTRFLAVVVAAIFVIIFGRHDG